MKEKLEEVKGLLSEIVVDYADGRWDQSVYLDPRVNEFIDMFTPVYVAINEVIEELASNELE